MKLIYRCLVWTCIALPASRVSGQEDAAGPADKQPPATAGEESPPRDPAAFPEPFSELAGGIGGLADNSQGLLSITDVRYAEVDRMGMAVIWTVRANRDMTYRRFQQLLTDYRDVRFYVKYEKTRTLLHTTLLSYPALVDQAASNAELMRRSMETQVWVPLDLRERRRIVGQSANLVIFQKRPRDVRR